MPCSVEASNGSNCTNCKSLKRFLYVLQVEPPIIIAYHRILNGALLMSDALLSLFCHKIISVIFAKYLRHLMKFYFL